MTAINFPQNPNINNTFTINNKSWRWNGISWNALSLPTTLSSGGGGGGTAAAYYEAAIPSSAWVNNGSNPSTVEITVTGIKADDRPYVSLDYSKILAVQEISSKSVEFNKIFRVEVISENTLKFYGPVPLIVENLDVLISVV